MNTAQLNMHNFGMQNLMQGGQHAHGHNTPVAGMMLPPLTGGQPMAGPAFAPGGGVTYGNKLDLPQLPDLAGGIELDENGKIKMGKQKRKMTEGVPQFGVMGMQPPEMPFGGYRAKGGPVRPGSAYVVGEEGEELFVPNVPGFIVPSVNKPNAGNRGRLVTTSRGGVMWQRDENGTDPLATAPPQSSMPRPIDAPFAGGSLTSRAPGGEMTGPLSTRKRQIGGGMTPERRLKQMQRRAITRGDDATVIGIAQAQMGYQARDIDRAFQAEQRGMDRDYGRERDATNFDQGMQMWNLDRAFQTNAQQQQRKDALDAEKRRNERSDQEWNRNREAELKDRENSSIDAPFTMTDPSGQFTIPGVKTKSGEFRPMGGAYPVKKPEAAPTTQQIDAMREDADKRGYDLVQLPSGEWKLERKASTPAAGRETETYDAEGKLTGKTRSRPLGGGTSKAGTGYW